MPKKYVPILRKESEKAAIAFLKMKYQGKYTYKGFLMLWHEYWKKDLSQYSKRHIKQDSLVKEDQQIWLARYTHYLNRWKQWEVKNYTSFIHHLRELALTDDLMRRLHSHKLVANQTHSNKKLGGYRLVKRIVLPNGKAVIRVVAGNNYDLSAVSAND